MKNNKTLSIILVVLIGAMAILRWKITIFNGSDAISLSTDPNPLKLGQATFIIDVKDKSGKPVDNATVSFDLNMTTMNMGTQQGNATPKGNGRYSAAGRMSMRGPWKIYTKVTMPDGKVINKNFTVNVP